MPLDLDRTDWNIVEGPYGPAPELRDALATLAGGGAAAARRGALETVLDVVNHQDLITEAAPVATPYLVELANDPACPDRAALLVLLGKLSVSGSDVRFTLEGRPRPVWPEAEAIRRLLEPALDAFLGALRDDKPTVRAAAAFLVGLLAADPARSAAAMRDALADEKTGAAKATELLALAFLGEGDTAAFEKLAGDADPTIRGAAVIALALGAPRLVSEDVSLELLDVAAKKPIAGVLWFDGELDNLAAIVLADAAAQAGDADVLFLLLDAVRKKPTYRRVAIRVVQSVLGRGAPPKEMRLATELAPLERKVLEELAARNLVGATSVQLRDAGLMSYATGLARFLGLTPQGPLDQVIGGEPLWRLATRVMGGRAPEQVWIDAVRGLGVERAIDVCRDAGVGPYVLESGFPPRPGADDREDRVRFAGLIARTLVAAAPRARLVAEADALASKPIPPQATWPACFTAAVVLALVLTAEVGAEALEPRFDPLVTWAMNGELATPVRAVLEKLPLQRREALVRTVPFDHYEEEDSPGRRHAVARSRWSYADLCPTRATVVDVVAAIAAWPKHGEVPEARAIEVLTAIGGAAPDVVRDAAAGPDERLARIAARALGG